MSLSLLLTAALIFPSSAMAQGITIEDTVKEGEVVDHNLVLSGPTVKMDGTVEGDLLAIGDQVTINGEVNGNQVVVGNQVVLNGPVSGSVYIGAATLVVGPEASVERDVSFIGGMFETQEASSVTRDLNLVSLDANMAGTTGRDVNALIGPMRLGIVIYNFMQDQGWLPKTTALQLRSTETASAGQTALAGLTFQSVRHILYLASPAGAPGLQDSTSTEAWSEWGIALLRNIGALLIIGLLAAWLLPMQLRWTSNQPQSRPWRSLLTGFLILLLGWFVAILVLLLFLGLAFFLFWASLPNLGFLVGSLGLLAVGLAMVVYWLSIAYFSKVIVAFLLGRILFERFMPKYENNRFATLIIGVIVYALAASIPYLGWVFSVVTTMFGLGALWIAAFPQRRVEAEPVLQQPADVEIGLPS